jgi:hypothetical protein
MEKPAIKLFTWNKAILIITLCVGAVCDRVGHAYHQKGHLDSADLLVAATSIVTAFCAVAFVIDSSASVVREFRLYWFDILYRFDINDAHRVLNWLPFPIYANNRKCPEGNQIKARH